MSNNTVYVGDMERRLQQIVAERNLLAAACQRVVKIIEAVEDRCMAVDGPVTKTSYEITDDELCAIYKAAKEALT